MSQGTSEELEISQLVLDPKLQMRPGLDEPTVERYAALTQDGVALPAIDVFTDGKRQRVAAGYHRVEAAKRAGRTKILCNVRAGGFREAWLHAIATNAHHGLPRCDRTVERTMREVLGDAELRTWTDRRLAGLTGLPHVSIGRWRKRLESRGVIEPVENRTTSNGRTIKSERSGAVEQCSTAHEPARTETDEDRAPVLTDEDRDETEAEAAAAKASPKAQAAAFLKQAEASLSALQDNMARAQQNGARVDLATLSELCRRVFAVIERGKASL